MKRKNIRSLFGAILSVCMILSTVSIPVSAEKLEDVETIYEDGVQTEENVNDVPSPDEDEQPAEPAEPAEPAGDDNAVAGNLIEDNKEVTLPAKSIRLESHLNNQIVIGSTFQIKYIFSPRKSDDRVTYYNFNKNIVKVDENGLVTAVGYGTARIRLKTTSGKKCNIYFVVTDKDGNENADAIKGNVTSVEFADKYAMLRVGKEYLTEPIFYPPGMYDDLTYTSSDPSVASVTSDGRIKGIRAGSATITAKTPKGISAEVIVTVYDDIYRGIDVSKWQGVINWKKVAISGVDFVMIRSSYGSDGSDEMLAKNVAGCEKYGIPYGFYHFTYAKTPKEAKKEARFFLKSIKKYSPEYPIVLDIEAEFYKKMSKKEVTAILTAFMDELENAGYYAMVYNSPNFIKECIDENKLKKYDIWIACWGDEERLNSHYDGKYGMWQYSSTGKVNGITGDVDMDYSYKDYPAVIKKNKLNNM